MTDQPTGAAFDLDAVIAEATATPFTFTLGGETFTMRSPEDADWQVALNSGNSGAEGTRAFVAELLGDDFERFAAHRVPGRALNRLVDACQKHYGVTPGESGASTAS